MLATTISLTMFPEHASRRTEARQKKPNPNTMVGTPLYMAPEVLGSLPVTYA